MPHMSIYCQAKPHRASPNRILNALSLGNPWELVSVANNVGTDTVTVCDYSLDGGNPDQQKLQPQRIRKYLNQITDFLHRNTTLN